MGFYFVILGFLSIFSFIEINKKNHRTQNKIVVAILLVFFILSFIRWEVGTDWDSYYDYFNTIEKWNFGEIYDKDTESIFEPGYAALNILVFSIFNNYTFFLFVFGTLIFTYQYKIIKEQSGYPIISLLVLWGSFFGNIFFVRISLAVILTTYSIRYITTQSPVKFVTLILIASLFHRTALICLFTYFLFKKRISSLTIIISTLVTLFVGQYFGIYFLEFVTHFIPASFSNKLSFYIEVGKSFDESAVYSSELLILKSLFNKVFILVLALWYRKKVESLYPNFNGYINLFWYGTILQFVTMSASDVFIRFSSYFDFLQILIFPYILHACEKKIKKILILAMIILLSGLRLYINLSGNYETLYVPFRTIWD